MCFHRAAQGMLWEIHRKHDKFFLHTDIDKFLLHTDINLEWGIAEDVLMLQVTV